METENKTQHFIGRLPAAFTLENVGHCPVCSPVCCAAARFGDVRDFLVILTLAAPGLSYARLNNTLGYGISLGKYFHPRIKIYC